MLFEVNTPNCPNLQNCYESLATAKLAGIAVAYQFAHCYIYNYGTAQLLLEVVYTGTFATPTGEQLRFVQIDWTKYKEGMTKAEKSAAAETTFFIPA